MSDENKANTVEVPRELVDRLLAWSATNKDLFLDLRACIKPRRWVFERKYVRLSSMADEIAVFHDQKYSAADLIPVRVTVEEIA